MSSKREKLCFYEYDKQMAAAFKMDCEEFLEEWEKLKSLKFEDFAKVWQLKNFTFVFSGQRYALLLRELCENYFYICKKYLMSPDTIFTQIGAFYLMYGLYYKQPLKGWVKIRLILDEYKKILNLMEVMKSRGEYEPIYIFSKMKVDHAFMYTALPKPLGPEERFVKSYETYLDYTVSASKKDETLMKFNEIVLESDLVKDMEKTNDEYQNLMQKYAEKCPGLVPFSSTIMKDLEEAHQEVIRNELNSRSLIPPESKQKNKKTRKQIVRERAIENKHAIYRGKRKVKMAIDIGIKSTAAFESVQIDGHGSSDKEGHSELDIAKKLHFNVATSSQSKVEKATYENSETEEDSADDEDKIENCKSLFLISHV